MAVFKHFVLSLFVQDSFFFLNWKFDAQLQKLILRLFFLQDRRFDIETVTIHMESSTFVEMIESICE